LKIFSILYSIIKFEDKLRLKELKARKIKEKQQDKLEERLLTA
jgi:hypothetical protein